MTLDDTQNQNDDRGIPIDWVGIRKLSYPIQVLDRANQTQRTIANVSMAVNLDARQKGTHMSRFIQLLGKYRDGVNMPALPRLLDEMLRALVADNAIAQFTFPYFIEKLSPVSRIPSLMEYSVTMIGQYCVDGTMRLVLGAEIPVTSLCPCSKAISEGGAHNQRAYIQIFVRQKQDTEFLWIEELIDYAEQSGSSEIFPLLKRPDEKVVTEQAYNNPMFVEDIIRAVTVLLASDDRIEGFKVIVESQESIHAHNAWAEIVRGPCQEHFRSL